MTEDFLAARNSNPHFGQYGKSFQEKIFQRLISDREWAAQMAEVMDPTFFDVGFLEYLCVYVSLFTYNYDARVPLLTMHVRTVTHWVISSGCGPYGRAMSLC